MKTHKTFGLLPILITLILAAGCDDPVSPIEQPPQQQSGRLLFEGPEAVNFAVGHPHSVEYVVEHSGKQAIDVQVLRLPAGAIYEISNLAGEYRKMITITWDPAPDAGVGPHMIDLLATERNRGDRLAASFAIYCHQELPVPVDWNHKGGKPTDVGE